MSYELIVLLALLFPADEPAFSAAHSQTGSSCESLLSLKLPETTITLARLVPAGEFTLPGSARGVRAGPPPAGDRMAGDQGGKDLPSFCRVVGVVAPEINFEVWLPQTTGEKPWNGKFNGVGNGGLAGSISYGAMMQSLRRGYATASTDTGHVNKPGNDAWPLGRPDLLVDFASRSIHMTARAAKGIIKAHYGESPRYSYFTGCSCGGGQGLSEAQRYPADYDGIIAGAPANFPTHKWPGELYPAWVTHREPASLIPREKLPVITKAVLATCDAADGVADGVLEDPRRCGIDPSTLVCPGGDAPNCLTAAQADSVRQIYAGVKDPLSGKLFWPGFEVSSEPGWPGHIFDPFSIPLSYFKHIALQDPNWDWRTFNFAEPKNFAVLREASNRLGPILDSTNPDLTAFQRLGGKLIVYHGWVDQNIAPRNSISYYEKVKETMGEVTESFLRLFMVPGMGHCGGGPGTNTFDALAALEHWVEKGRPPDQIIASRVSGGKADRTRPLCPYPLVAKYRGSGSTDDAANFECRLP